jgi:prepilin-type processing-associated H-X9-DG protein
MLSGSFAVIGNRGVRNGTADSIIHDSSITLKIHGNNATWHGNVCFADGHVEFLRGFYMPNVLYQNRSGTWQADNLFRNDNRGSPTATGVTGNDCWLAITTNLYGTPDAVTSLKNSWD